MPSVNHPAPSYLAARGRPHTISSLAEHNCLGYTLSSLTGVDRWAFGAKGDATVAVSGNLRANNGEALRTTAIAGQGHGLAYLPTFIVADDLRVGTLVALDLNQPTVEFGGIYAVFLPDRHPAAKVRVFIDFIANRFAVRCAWQCNSTTFSKATHVLVAATMARRLGLPPTDR